MCIFAQLYLEFALKKNMNNFLFKDVVVCKKPCKGVGFAFNIGQKYRFRLDEDGALSQFYEATVPYKFKYIFVYNFESPKGVRYSSQGLRFHLDKVDRSNRGSIGCFYDYFYDYGELRVLKLKKIENSFVV